MDSRPVPGLALLVTAAAILMAPFLQPPWVLSVLVISFSLVLLFIRGCRYPAIALIVISALYGLSLISLFVFAVTLTLVIGGESAFRYTGGSGRSYLYYSICGYALSLLAMWYIHRFHLFSVLMGVLVALMLKTVLAGRDDALMIEGLGAAMTISLFSELSCDVAPDRLIVAASIAFIFGYFAYRLKTADLSGLFAGAIIGLLLIVFAGVEWFLLMLFFFIIGSGCTRYRFQYKVALGVEESHGGVRGYTNVFANGLVAAVGAVIFGITGHPAGVALFLGSLASASADTVASEIGLTGGTPRLITTLQPVPPGTNGGITLLGEIAALAGSIGIGAGAWLLSIADVHMAVIAVIAGFVGANVDSLIGATLENRGVVGNSGTNLLATFTGGIFALILSLPGVS
ncbi:MAG: DUF92 domain-containing protein [Methanoculleaceae archaeon]